MWSREAWTVAIVVLVAAGLAFSIIVQWCQSRRFLRAALLRERLLGEEVRHRIEAAEREVREGHRVCPKCQFENFRCVADCALCGAVLSATVTTKAPSGGTMTRVPDEARLARARRRKEWARRVDVEGRAFWFRTMDIAPYDSAGFVIRFPSVDISVTMPPAFEIVEATDADPTRSLIDDAPRIPLEQLRRHSHPSGIDCDDEGSKMDFPRRYARWVRRLSSLKPPEEIARFRLVVARDFALEDSIEQLVCIPVESVQAPVRITFRNESGIDAGGVHREWVMLMSELLTKDSPRKLFISHNHRDHSFFISDEDVGEDSLLLYHGVGRLIGRVLLDGATWGFRFARPLLKFILGVPVSFADLEDVDPILYKNLLWIVKSPSVDDLCLNFSVTEKTRDGRVDVIDLIPGGRSVVVTNENKDQYVLRRFQHGIFERIAEPLHAMLRGVYEVIPFDALSDFAPEELDYILCGTDEIDIEDWRANTVEMPSPSQHGINSIQWLWEEIEDMSLEYRRRLLIFATGSSRVPLGGFRNLTSYDGQLCPFTLQPIPYTTSSFISSHSCFNRLEIPCYRRRDELQQVLYAILDGDIHGFTTV